MTVAAQYVKESYLGDGSTRVFPFRFRVHPDLDPAVNVRVVVNASDGARVISPDSYALSFNPGFEGGSLHYPVNVWEPALAADESIVIYRATPLTQEEDFVNQGRYFPEMVENGLDKLTLIAQELKQGLADIDRDIKGEKGDMGPQGAQGPAGPQGPPGLPGGNGSGVNGLTIAHITLDAQDVTNGYFDLPAGNDDFAEEHLDCVIVLLNTDAQHTPVDYIATTDAAGKYRRISWDGLGMDGIVSANDCVWVIYVPDSSGGGNGVIPVSGVAVSPSTLALTINSGGGSGVIPVSGVAVSPSTLALTT